VNALRLAVVWKYGGMYMDADMVFVRDPTLLPVGMSTQVRRPSDLFEANRTKRGFGWAMSSTLRHTRAIPLTRVQPGAR
jgi:hypothetical protein